ncbi:MAG: FAD-binding oxidoreductase [Planctomycetaceae bacterium]
MHALTRRRFVGRVAAVAGGLSATSSPSPAGQPATYDRTALRGLREALRGGLVVPDDASYDTDRRVFYWNPRTETRPVVIVRCGHEDDVKRAVEFARRHALEIAVRSGGHSHLAWGGSNGLVIDLAPLRRITIDSDRRLVHAQAGVLGGEVAVAAGRHGLVPVLGQCPGVGATGVTLGGGLGWLSGLFGACCDSLVSACVVSADGTLREADDEHDPDLTWALRGAGANFGIATSFTARLYPLESVIGGDLHYHPRDARAVLRGFRDVMREAPDAFQATLNLTTGERGLFISLCHAGAAEQAEPLLRSLRALARPTREDIREQPYATLATRAAATAPVGMPPSTFRAIEAVYRESVSDDMIDIVVDRLNEAPPDAVMGLSHYMHGAVCRVDPAATAFPHRRTHAVHLRVACQWSDPAESERRFAWTDAWREMCRPKAGESLYATYQTYSTTDGARSIYGANHDRLAALKARHDPDNVFRRNANVVPAQA